MRSLIGALDLLSHFKGLTQEEKQALLEKALQGNCRENLNTITALLSCGAVDRLKCGDLNFEEVLKEKFPLANITNFIEKFTNTFGTFRDQTALFYLHR